MNPVEPQRLKLRRIPIDTSRENVVFLHADCGAFPTLGFRALSKVQLSFDHKTAIGTLDVVRAPWLGVDEVGVCEYMFERLGVAEGAWVALSYPGMLESTNSIRRKLAGARLSRAEYDQIVRDIVDDRFSKVELTAFVCACSQNNLDRDEIVDLTEAMVAVGRTLSWDGGMVVDKHCIGGIPGNRTTPIVVSILAAHGLKVPKTSSRAITSPAGTADTMEVFCNVELSLPRMREIVDKHNGCLAWGGAIDLSPADDVIISVERPLNIDSEGQMIASILSKKKSAGSTHLVLDIPLGPTAKVRRPETAAGLRRMFEYVAGRVGMHVEVVISDGRQPVGRGVGPVLEARDVLAVLRNEANAPADLREHALALAGRGLEFAPGVRGGQGLELAREILRSGKALARFEAIVDAQGRRARPPEVGAYSFEIKAGRAGTVQRMDNFSIARLAKLAGAPVSKGAGVEVLRKLGEPVKTGEPVLRVHSATPAERRLAEQYAENEKEMVSCEP
ncbi:MAG: thymidine phosphorylase family protein [Planctomycetes bacterium]|nr:thymidine phosphorylase family protein [Planctomycetota bacterium]